MLKPKVKIVNSRVLRKASHLITPWCQIVHVTTRERSMSCLQWRKNMKIEVSWKEMSLTHGRFFFHKDWIDLEKNHRTISIWMRCSIIFQPFCSSHHHKQGFWMVCRQSWEWNQVSTRHIPVCLCSTVIPYILFCMWILKYCWWNNSCTTSHLWSPMEKRDDDILHINRCRIPSINSMSHVFTTQFNVQNRYHIPLNWLVHSDPYHGIL